MSDRLCWALAAPSNSVVKQSRWWFDRFGYSGGVDLERQPGSNYPADTLIDVPTGIALITR
jgi:hypothetical protein